MENNNILLLVTEKAFYSLNKKHKRELECMGFIVHKYFDPIYFSTFTALDSLICYGIDCQIAQVMSYNSYIEQNNSLSLESKQIIRNVLYDLYNNGIYPTSLSKNDIYISKNLNPVLFISKGLYSQSFKISHIYNNKVMKTKIENFVNSL